MIIAKRSNNGKDDALMVEDTISATRREKERAMSIRKLNNDAAVWNATKRILLRLTKTDG